MRFSKVLLFATAAFAAPAALESRQQQQTAVGTVSAAIDTLKQTSGENTAALTQAVGEIKDNVDAQVQATIKANLQGIADSLKKATDTIVKATSGAAGGIGGSVKGLTQAQVDQLVKAIGVSQEALKGIQAALTVTVTDLTPATQALVKAQLEAAKAAIQPFITPTAAFIDAAKKAGASAGLAVTGLENAQKAFEGVAKDIVASLGLPSVETPGIETPGVVGAINRLIDELVGGQVVDTKLLNGKLADIKIGQNIKGF